MTKQHTEIHAGVADDDDEKRELLADLRKSVDANPKIKKDKKKELLKKLNRSTMIELIKTRHEMMKNGKAQMKDQKKQEKPRG